MGRAPPPPAYSGAGQITGMFGGHHIFSYSTTFFFREKSLRTGSLLRGTSVRNPDSSVAFRTSDSKFSLRHREIVYDAKDQPIATLHKKKFTMRKAWQVYQGDSLKRQDLLAEIKPGLSLFKFSGKTIKVVFKGSQQPALTIKGNLFARSFDIEQDKRVVAQVRRHGKYANLKNMWTGQDSFSLECHPGFDTAMMVLATLVINDILQ